MLEDDTSVSYMLLKNMFDGKEVKLINAKVKTVKLAGMKNCGMTMAV